MRTIVNFLLLLVFGGLAVGAVAAAFVDFPAPTQEIVQSVDLDVLGEDQ